MAAEQRAAWQVHHWNSNKTAYNLLNEVFCLLVLSCLIRDDVKRTSGSNAAAHQGLVTFCRPTPAPPPPTLGASSSRCFGMFLLAAIGHPRPRLQPWSVSASTTTPAAIDDGNVCGRRERGILGDRFGRSLGGPVHGCLRGLFRSYVGRSPYEGMLTLFVYDNPVSAELSSFTG